MVETVMIGRTISHYKILDKIGAGGMGEVYLAEDARLGRKVALKFLPAELTREENAKRRFVHEARAASALDHPNICQIHDIDESPEGRLFICMSHCEGKPLKDLTADGPLPMDRAVDIAIKTANGLEAAHEAGVVHRDVKSANIMVSDGDVKIIDFGLAKLAGASRITRPGVTPGTVAYKSPEQTRSEDVDSRADIWSLGVVMYEMVTGELPFRGDYEQAIVYSILNRKHEPVTNVRHEIPSALVWIIDKCLEKDPRDRYQSAGELVTELRRLARDMGWSDESDKWLTWRRVLRIAVKTAAAAAVFVAVWGVIQVGPICDGSRLPRQQHLAVLPFVNVGGDPASDAFCDGLVETLTSKLTQLEQYQGSLWVVPASEVRDRDISSASEARDAFGVNLAVTGSIQRWGQGYRVTMNLVDTESQRQVKSALIDDPMKVASTLQDETVVKLAAMLNVELQPGTGDVIAAGGTPIAAAYELYLQGRGYLLRHDQVENIDRAIGLFNSAIVRDESYALAYAGLGESYWRKWEYTKEPQLVDLARSYCNRAIEINDLLAPVHVTLGIINRGTGRYREAIDEFEKARRINPASYEAHLELAIAYQKLDWVEEAEEIYLEAIALRPDYWSGYTNLGYFYYRNGRLDDAITMMRKVAELAPGDVGYNVRARNNLIAFYFMKGDDDRAEDMFQKSIAIKPNEDAYSNMATVHIFRGRYAEAIPMLESAIELGRNVMEIWGNLGDAYRYTPGNGDKAVEAYRRAIELAYDDLSVNPNDPCLRSRLATYCAKAGDLEMAMKQLEMARDQGPTDADVLFHCIIVYEIADRRDDALRAVSEIVERDESAIEKIDSDPELSELRKDARYPQLVQR